MKKNYLSLVYKMLIVLVLGTGLYLNFKFISFKSGVVYFTLQSNILCFIFYVFLTVYLLMYGNYKKFKYDKKPYIILKGLISANITLTMVMYTFLELTNSVSVYDAHLIECLFVHYITPVMILLDYIVFDKKGNMQWHYPLIWGVIPVLYGIFNFIYTISGGTFVEGKYAYAFYNIDKYGISGVAINCILILVGFFILNFIVVYLDRKVGEENEERRIK